MFSNKKSGPVVDKSAIGTVIGKGIIIEGGALTGDGNLRIDGTFTGGEIAVNGHIVISDTGLVRGNIKAYSALLAGQLIGNINTEESTHMASTAVVQGNIESKTVIMDEDAIFNGNCRMDTGNALIKDEPPVVEVVHTA